MTKLLIFPSSIKQIDDTLHLTDGYILSIKDLSVNSPFYMDINSLEEIVLKLKRNQKQIFISLNKNMFNSDLDNLKETLLNIDKLNIDGIFYYDISVLSLVKKLNLDIDLVWSQEHMTTNYLTCNYYNEKKVKYVYLSSEITLNEILEISKKTKMLTIMPIFGYLPMFNSKRHIVKNYLETFNINDNSKINYIEKENKKYPIIDEKDGTTVYSSNIMCALEEFLMLNNSIDYVTLNSFNIDNNKFKEVLECFREINENNKKQLNEKLNKMFDNIDKGFLYKETIYRVKKDEKRSN